MSAAVPGVPPAELVPWSALVRSRAAALLHRLAGGYGPASGSPAE
jgi:hypothetical protein